jgi:MFS family permease
MDMVIKPTIKHGHFRPASLDAINFLLSDVRGALGPYLNVFLVTQQHWSQSEVGLVTSISGLLGLSVQTPIGAMIDETYAKRGVIILALAVLAIGTTVIFALPSFWPVAIANNLMSIAGDVCYTDPSAKRFSPLAETGRPETKNLLISNDCFHWNSLYFLICIGGLWPTVRIPS